MKMKVQGYEVQGSRFIGSESEHSEIYIFYMTESSIFITGTDSI